jgi:hypothetical protein
MPVAVLDNTLTAPKAQSAPEADHACRKVISGHHSIVAGERRAMGSVGRSVLWVGAQRADRQIGRFAVHRVNGSALIALRAIATRSSSD